MQEAGYKARLTAAVAALVLGAGAVRADDAVAPAATASLTITVNGVQDGGGKLHIGVFDEAHFSARALEPVARKVTNAHPPTQTVTIDDIPPGTYGVKMYQDLNQNGFFDFGAKFTEPFGVSNDPEVHVGGPTFDEAKFTLVPGPNSIAITLH
jgi:uncharacterized protein (DUF2141 family)